MRLIPFSDLKNAKGIGYSKCQIWRKVRDGTFPAPIKLGAARNAWVEQELDAWIAERIAQRDSAAPEEPKNKRR